MESQNLDTNLYSRQIGVYGIETMKEIIKLNIFIYGMRGLGIEIAKNIILAGPKKVTIYDSNICKISDLTSNFYITKNDVENNTRRDDASIKKLSLLNPFVEIEIMKDDNLNTHLEKNIQVKETKYDVVIISEFYPEEEIKKINTLCRKNNIGFIYTVELGIFGFCFVDFGDNFIVKDENGKDPLSYCIKSISKEKKGIVTIDTTAGKLKLGNKDKVIFKEIEGMTELNNKEPKNIKVLSNNSFEIDDTSNFSEYISGGIVEEIKIPKIYNFKSLEERLEIPYTEDNLPNPIDFSKESTNEIIHIGILALNKFYKENNSLPKLNDEKQANELLEISKKIYETKCKENELWLNELEDCFENFEETFRKTILRLSLWSKAEISPIATFLGGISGQEALKITGKYRPINQWLWIDFSETVEKLEANVNRKLQNDRYDDQIAIYGNEIQEKISNLNLFIIGAGALGCEFLKCFALMGISTKEESKITITDNDSIEISNLNRQFLFRYEDVSKPKSITASNAIKEINENSKIYPMKTKIGKESENVFDEQFWENQNYIINAVDNVDARIYISEQSKIFNKILIDSGTIGTMANSQVIIPNKTIEYSVPMEENIEQENIAMCTLRNFPTLITHCIEWARDNFEGCFVTILQDLKKFCENKESFYSDLEKNPNIDYQIKYLEKIIKFTKLVLSRSYDDCLEISFNEYLQKFNYDIIQILTDYPPDSINEDGSKFWSANKRVPKPLPFDCENKLIMMYIKKYADILANSLSIQIIDDMEYIKKKINTFEVKEFIPIKKTITNKNRYQNTDEEESIEDKKLKKKKKIEEIKIRLNIQKENLNKIKTIANKIDIPDDTKNLFKIKEFEKDDDSNGHIEFIYAASNLRANNYKIENCDIYKAKIIAGKIIPAIATTTASIVGLVSLQLISLIQTEDIKYLREGSFNLAFNNFMNSSPTPCGYVNENNEENIKYIPEKYTIWDFIEIKESMTLKKFLNYMDENYKIKISLISSNHINLYDSNLNEEILDNKIEEVYNKKAKTELFEGKRFLILDILGTYENLIAKTPKIKYIFK